MSRTRANRHSRALPVAGGRAAGHRAAQAVHQPATSQNLENVIGVPAPHVCVSTLLAIDDCTQTQLHTYTAILMQCLEHCN